MKNDNIGYCSETLLAGLTRLCILDDEKTMGSAAQETVRNRVKTAAAENKRIAFWLMAAPSAFSWYDAFIEDCRRDHEFAGIVRRSEFFQFDDYPIPRDDSRFPVTFRHLLETRLYNRLGDASPPDDHIHPLEIDGSASDAIRLREYADSLKTVLDDPDTYVIEIKGIGMDGHWGFHGRETPIDHPAEMIRIPINRQNRIQQTIDWPEFFPDVASVPDSAATASVGLFLRAQTIVDLVPQRSKLFALLASYGTDNLVPEIPSSALKNHQDSYSFLTRTGAEALLQFRSNGHITEALQSELDGIWNDDEESRRWARSVLKGCGITSS